MKWPLMHASWGMNVKWIEGGGWTLKLSSYTENTTHDTIKVLPPPTPRFFAALPTDIQLPRWSGPRREGRYHEGVRRK
jgi:hypothetical protein